MRARPLLGLVLSAAVLAAASGVAGAAGPVKSRFTLDSSRDGFVRLDTQTGTVTHCSVIKGAWTCDAILSGDAGLAARLDALSLEVARLTAVTAALEARLSRSPKEDARVPVATPTATPAGPPAVEPSGRTSVARTIVSRFLTMVRLLRHGKDETRPPLTPS